MNNMNLTRTVILILTTAITMTSCLGPAKIDKWVAQKYTELPPPAKKKHEQIAISSNVSYPGTTLSTTEKKTSNMLPLIVYWQFDYKNTCTINPQIPVNIFTTTVISYAGHGLQQKLNGQRIELTVEKIPTKFAIDDKGHLIFVGLAYAWDYLTVLPEEKDFVVSYKLFDAKNQQVKQGEVALSGSADPIDVHMFQSLKKKTWAFLDQYDAGIAVMSKHIVDKLVTELKAGDAVSKD
jgi:hypothetical protein